MSQKTRTTVAFSLIFHQLERWRMQGGSEVRLLLMYQNEER